MSAAISGNPSRQDVSLCIGRGMKPEPLSRTTTTTRRSSGRTSTSTPAAGVAGIGVQDHVGAGLRHRHVDVGEHRGGISSDSATPVIAWRMTATLTG